MIQFLIDLINSGSKLVIQFFLLQVLFSVILFFIVFTITRLLKSRMQFLALGLWSLIFLRLVLPPDFSFPFSARMLVHNILNFPDITQQHKFQEVYLVDDTQNKSAISGQITNLPVNRTYLSNILFFTWLTGFVFCFIIYIKRRTRYKRLLKNAKICNDQQVLLIITKWKRLFHIKRPIKILYSDQMVTPFTIGIFKPLIYLPKYFFRQKDVDTIESSIAHEMAHIKYVDDIWIKIQNFIQLFYFFNPIVWLAGRQLHQVREQFCDAAVISKKSLTRKTYGYGLLNAARMNLTTTNIIFSLPSFTNQKERLVQRIQHLKQTARYSKTHFLLSYVVIILIGLLFLPMAHQSNSGQLSLSDNQQFISPVPNGYIVIEYGKDWNSTKKEYYFHNGIDIVCEKGTTAIVASADGNVISTNGDDIFTKFKEITLTHKEGFQTRYLHLDSVYVHQNQQVKKGQIIGHTPFCVHFEVLKDGKLIDPEDYMTLGKKLTRKVIKE